MARKMLEWTLRLLAVTVFVLLPVGCARFPENAGSGPGTQLVVTMTVAGRIRPDYVYFVLFNVNPQPGVTGPIPVVAPPWGNGFAAGTFTHFLRYQASQPNDGYQLFAVVPGTNLQIFTPLGAPDQWTAVQTDGRTIQFRIALSRLATSSVPVAQITSLQVNFIATDRIPVPSDTGTKLFDALGDARQPTEVNSPFTISSLTQAAVYNDASVRNEPAGDVTEAGNGTFVTVSEPDLDITDWSVEVRS